MKNFLKNAVALIAAITTTVIIVSLSDVLIARHFHSHTLLSSVYAYTAKAPDASKRLECDDVFLKHAASAWMLTRMGTKTQEAGFRVEVINGDYVYSEVKMGNDNEMHMHIPMTSNTIAIFHIHPNAGIGHPVGKDFNSQVPNYVFSKEGLFVTVPSTSAETSEPGSNYKQLSGCFVGKEYLR